MKAFLVLLLLLPTVCPALAETPKNELVIALEDNPPHFNPVLLSGSLVGSIGAQLFAGLTRLSPEGDPRPYFASCWTHSRDYRTFTFSLREGFFHDGTPITASDVAFSIMASRDNHPFGPMLEPVEAVETPDAHTAVVRLSRPFPALPAVLIPSLVPIQPRHVFGAGRPRGAQEANLAPVGSGPFMLEAFVPNRYVRLVRNPRFFLPGKPLLDRVTFRIYWDQAEIPLALSSGEADVYLFSSPLILDAFRQNYPFRSVRITPIPNLHAYLVLDCNLEAAPLDDPRVRKALSLALDRNALARLFGMAEPQYGPIPPGAPYHAPLMEPFDPELAGRLLDEAGYPRGQNGKRFTLVLDYTPGTDFFPPVVGLLRHEFARLGVEIVPRDSMQFSEWMRHVSTGAFQVSLDELFAWHDPVVGIHRLYSARNARSNIPWANMGKYANPHAERLMSDASSETDPGKRRELYAAFQRVVAEDHPMLWLATMPYGLLSLPPVRHLDTLGLGTLSPLDGIDKEGRP